MNKRWTICVASLGAAAAVMVANADAERVTRVSLITRQTAPGLFLAQAQPTDTGVAPGATTAPTMADSGASGCTSTKKIIYEDKFTDDSGGWEDDSSVKVEPPHLVLRIGNDPNHDVVYNATFLAREGDFCVEAIAPQIDSKELELRIGVAFWATDYDNLFEVYVTSKDEVDLARSSRSNWSTAFAITKPGIFRKGPNEKNVIRAIATSETITVMVNGQTIKKVRAQQPEGDLKFGFYASVYGKPKLPDNVPFKFTGFKVTAP